MITPDLKALRDAVYEQRIRAIDLQLARYVGKDQATLFWTTLLLSQRQGDNHVCLDLTALAGQELDLVEGLEPVRFPDLSDWLEQLKQSVFVADSEYSGGDIAPLMLDRQRLYLSRYWHYECEVARQLQKRASSISGVDLASVSEQLSQIFPEQDDTHEINWQKVACALAVLGKLLVLTGGPGTGKTTTVIRLLALLLQQSKKPDDLVIRLAAPTGKAAVRMTESIRKAKQSLALPAELKQLIPEQASTLHRLLGVIPNSVAFRHDKKNPLRVDLLILDEASMVDLSMMAKLLDALPAECRLIILGDKDQLSSVEAGSILGDLCGSIELQKQGARMHYDAATSKALQAITDYDLSAHQSAATGISNAICMLQKSYRFGGGIGILALAVNRGDWPAALAALVDSGITDIELDERPGQVLRQASERYAGQFKNRAADPARVLIDFDDYRVLCATRKGPEGTEQMNEAIEQLLIRKGLVPEQTEFYPGRPVMITHNDYNVQLFNGDIGICLSDPDQPDQLRAYFLQSDGSVRALLPSRLPAHETAFAMTIHKSQGSEFTDVALLLPLGRHYQSGLTRELLYTGITRARKQVSLFAQKGALKKACLRVTERETGLAARLQG